MFTVARDRDCARCAHPEPIVERIRVRIAEMPGVMRDLVEIVVGAQPDMQIVAVDATDPAAFGTPADVVILGVASVAEPIAHTTQLYEHPHQRILALAIDGRRAVVYELRPHLTELGEISPDGLLAAIRAGRQVEMR